MEKNDIIYIGQVLCTQDNCVQLLTETFAKKHPDLVLAKLKVIDCKKGDLKDD